MTDYKNIFDGVESTLFRESTLPTDKLREHLKPFYDLEPFEILKPFKPLEDENFSDKDDEYYWLLVKVIFFAGIKTGIIKARLQTILKYFRDYKVVASYGSDKVNQIINDSDMLRHRPKVQACVDNARIYQSTVAKYGSFKEYLVSFEPTHPTDWFENIMLLREDLVCRFKFVGNVVAFHFLADIGMPCIKPDTVNCRIFYRLGLIESKPHILKAVQQGRKFAQATGHKNRYIDRVFVAYGQEESKELGINRGICLESNPRCEVCGITNYCNYYASL